MHHVSRGVSFSSFFFKQAFLYLTVSWSSLLFAGLFSHFPVPAVVTLGVIMMNRAVLHSIIHLRMVFYWL